MYVYFQNDKWFEEPTVRQHPWSVSEDNPDEAYCDFKAHPEAVEAVLLSFQPWSKYPSTQEFYRMIRWLNCDQSPFETNDARFSGPSPNNQFDLCQKKLVCSGGAMVFYRELAWNISPDSASWILRRLAGFRHEMRPSDMTSWLTGHSRSKLEKSGEGVDGWVELSHFPTCYTEAPGEQAEQFGLEVGYSIGAWGDTVEETLETFGRIVVALHQSLKEIAVDVPDVARTLAPSTKPVDERD